MTAKVQPRSPTSNGSRLVQTAEFSTTNETQAANSKLDEFSDDEQFELDATQWCDDNELLLSGARPIQQSAKTPVSRAAPKKPTPQVKAATKVEQKPPEKILPPVSDLDYVISNELFQAALKGKEGSAGSFWSHSMYRRVQPDGTTQNVKVHYCRSKQTMEDVCKKYFLGEKVLGFDMEWMMYTTSSEGVRRNISLIQMASASRIALFHLALFPKPDFVAPTFKEIMEDESVSKTGVNISGDCTRLKNFLGVETKGIFELSHLYKLVKHSKTGQLKLINRVVVPMATQVKDFLHLPMYKGPAVRQGNWMRYLDQQQIKYSASDAYAGVHLYHVMDYERRRLNPCPPLPEHYEKRLPIKVAEPQAPPETDAKVEANVAKADVYEADVPTEAATVLGAGVSPLPDSKPAPTSKSQTTMPTSKTQPIPPPSRPQTIPQPSRPQPTIDPRVVAANLRMGRWRSGVDDKRTKRVVAHSSAVRSYFIWHENADLTPGSVAKLLRDPPLKTNTVVTYILDAIAYEGFPYSKQRLKNEVLSFVAPDTVKYQALFKAVADV